MRPSLRSKSLSTSIKVKLKELFMDPTLTYRLSPIVLWVKDNNHLNALQNTVRRMILGLKSRKEKWVDELKEEI